jgi:hypothetical protein
LARKYEVFHIRTTDPNKRTPLEGHALVWEQIFRIVIFGPVNRPVCGVFVAEGKQVLNCPEMLFLIANDLRHKSRFREVVKLTHAVQVCDGLVAKGTVDYWVV